MNNELLTIYGLPTEPVLSVVEGNYELPTTIYANSLNAPQSQKFLVIPSITLFLCALVPLWLCLLPSTTVEEPLQISSFMQNKANFPDDKINVNKVLTKDYENETLSRSGKNKANSKPIKANLLNAQMNVTTIRAKDYKNKPPIRATKKQTQFSKRQKPMQTSLPKGIMKKTALSGSDKTKPNKPKQTQCLSAISVAGQRANFKGMNIEVADPAFRGRNQSSIRLEQLCENCFRDTKDRSVAGPFREMNLIGNIFPIFQVFGYDRTIPAFSVLIKIDKPRVPHLDCRRPLGPIVTRNGLRCRPVGPLYPLTDSQPNVLFRWMPCLIFDEHYVTAIVPDNRCVDCVKPAVVKQFGRRKSLKIARFCIINSVVKPIVSACFCFGKPAGNGR